MSKTFWSVTYSVWGRDCTSERWFDSKEAAYEFAAQDYHDTPVRHTYKNEKKIREIEEIVKHQAAHNAF